MDVLIETIVSKLRRLSVSKLQTILEFVSFLDWQESQTESSSLDENKLVGDVAESDRKADWQAFIQGCAGAFPDFPTTEGIRSEAGEDVAREQFFPTFYN